MEADSPVAASCRPSPNHGARRDGRGADSIVLHYTGMIDGQAALDRLCDPAAEVSCHYLVWENGSVVQLVPEARRAWHAGRGAWAGESDMNSASIGIEIVNPGHDAGAPPFPDPQIAAVAALCADICARLGIASGRVIGHSDMAPGRKIDPGEWFPWEVLFRAGIGHWVPPCPLRRGAVLGAGAHGADVARLQADLARYGYAMESTGAFDARTVTVIEAFQRHFRPARIDGVADASTLSTLADLLA